MNVASTQSIGRSELPSGPSRFQCMARQNEARSRIIDHGVTSIISDYRITKIEREMIIRLVRRKRSSEDRCWATKANANAVATTIAAITAACCA